MTKKTTCIFLFTLLLVAGILISSEVLATTQVSWPTSPLTGVTIDGDSELHHVVAYLYGWGIGLGVILAFLMIVVGGLQYMISGVGGDVATVAKALERIRSAILGLVLLLSSWLILNTINPQLTNLQPLPSLWGNEDLIGDMMNMNRINEPPCDHVDLFIQRDFQGGYVTRRPSSDDYYEDPFIYLSAIGWRKITDEDREILEEMEEAGTPDQRRIKNDEYIEANSCSITLYESTGAFFWHDNCGRASFFVTIPNNDIGRSVHEEINCYRVDNIGFQKED